MHLSPSLCRLAHAQPLHVLCGSLVAAAYIHFSVLLQIVCAHTVKLLRVCYVVAFAGGCSHPPFRHVASYYRSRVLATVQFLELPEHRADAYVRGRVHTADGVPCILCRVC